MYESPFSFLEEEITPMNRQPRSATHILPDLARRQSTLSRLVSPTQTAREWKADQPLPSPRAPRRFSRKPGLLVVDDNAMVLSVLDGALWHHGFLVWTAGNGQDAQALYQELAADIDLVLLDVQMPGLDGPATLAALQQLNPVVRSCFMSGDTGPYTEEELLERGAAVVFQKPFHVHEVARCIWQLINLPCLETASHGSN